MGETLLEFVKRTRLERALYLLSHTEQTLTEIAFAVGFNSSSDFSRSFKAYFGVPPRRFDLEAWRALGRAKITTQPPAAGGEGFSVQLRKLPARRVAYRRVLRPFEPGRVPEAARSFVAWATSRRGTGCRTRTARRTSSCEFSSR